MVKTDLTRDMIDAGRRLLERLDRTRFRVRACFWFYFPDSDRWRLVVASPEVRSRGPHAAYLKIQTAVHSLPETVGFFGPSDVKALKDTDPLIKLLRKAISTGPGICGIRFTSNSVNGTFIDDAYVYRLT